MSSVLDLDETLVHCSLEEVDCDLTLDIPYQGLTNRVYVKIRPGFEEFVKRVSSVFEVVVFTASQKIYGAALLIVTHCSHWPPPLIFLTGLADMLLDKLDPSGKFFQHRLFREACIFVNGNYLKDLTVLGSPGIFSLLLIHQAVIFPA